MRRIRHPHWREVSGAIATSQLLRVALVCLDPIAGLHRHQRGRDYLTAHAQLRQLPVQHVPGRAGLVTHPQLLRLAQFLNQLAHRLRIVRDHTHAAHFPTRLGNGHRNGSGMDIKTHKSYVLHRRLPFVCGSAPRFLPDPKRNPRFANRGPVVPS